jgi:hypothetical protein
MPNALIFLVAAICIFIIVAVLAFVSSTISMLTLVGIIAIGLACFTAGHIAT